MDHSHPPARIDNQGLFDQLWYLPASFLLMLVLSAILLILILVTLVSIALTYRSLCHRSVLTLFLASLVLLIRMLQFLDIVIHYSDTLYTLFTNLPRMIFANVLLSSTSSWLAFFNRHHPSRVRASDCALFFIGLTASLAFLAFYGVAATYQIQSINDYNTIMKY